MKRKNTVHLEYPLQRAARWVDRAGLPGIAVIAAFGLVSLGWFRGEYGAVAGYDFATSLRPLDEIRRALHIWDDRLYAGSPNFIALATLPYLLLQYSFEYLAGSLYRGQMLFFTLLFLLPGLSMRFFLRCASASPDKRESIAFFGALFYMLNAFVFVKWNRGELIALFAYGMLPLYLAAVERGLNGPVSARFLIFFSCALFFYPASLGHSADFLITTGLIIGYALWKVLFTKDALILKRALFLAVFATLASSWWALPLSGLIRAGGAGLTSFTGQDTLLVDYYSSWARILNVMKLWFSPVYPTAVEFGSQFYRPGTVLIPILAFSALLFKRNRNVLFFSFVGVMGLWLSKGTSPPFAGIYRWMYLNLPYFFVFRAPSRCFPMVYTLSLSVLLGYSASSIASKIRSFRKGGAMASVFSGGVVLLILFNAWPLFCRDTVFRTKRGDVLYPGVFVDIPSYYGEINGWIRERIGQGRLHSFHDKAYLNYTWGYSSTDIAPRVIEAPQTLKFSQELNFGSGGFHELMDSFDRRFWSWDFGRADKILGLFGVKYILLTKDVMRRYLPDTNYYEILPAALASMPGIRPAGSAGQWAAYENSYALPLVYAGRAAKLLFADAGALITLSHTDYLDRPIFIRVERLDHAHTDLPKGSIDELVIADRNFWDVLSENIPGKYRTKTGEGLAVLSRGGLHAIRVKMKEDGSRTPVTVSVDGRPAGRSANDKGLNGIRWIDLGVIDVAEGWHNVALYPPDVARELMFVPVSVWETEKSGLEDFFKKGALPLANIFREKAFAARDGLVLPVFLTGPYGVEASFTREILKEKSAGFHEDYGKAPDLLNWSVFGGGEIGFDDGVRITPGVGKDSVKAAKKIDFDGKGYVDLEEYPYLSVRGESRPSSLFDTDIVLGVDFDGDGWADDTIRFASLQGDSPLEPVNLAEIIKKKYGFPGKLFYRAVWVLFDLKGSRVFKGDGAPAPSFRVKGLEFYRYIPVLKPGKAAQADPEIRADGMSGMHFQKIAVKARSGDTTGFKDNFSLQDVVVKISGKKSPPPAYEIPEMEWRRISPVKYSIVVKRRKSAVPGPFWIVLNDSYDRGWQACILKDGKRSPVSGHYMINGFANGWWVDNVEGSEFTVLMEFAPRRGLLRGTVISISSSLVLIAASALSPLFNRVLGSRPRP